MPMSGPGGGLEARKKNFRGLLPLRAVHVLGGAPMGFPEHCTEADAKRLAERIEKYWRAGGVTVKCSIEQVCRSVTHNGRAIFAVRSDMHNGLPAK